MAARPVNAHITIRSARIDDAESIAQLLAQLGYPSDPDFVAERIAALAVDDKASVVVACAGSALVGVVGLHYMPLLHVADPLCRITVLVVSEQYRRQGVGRNLVEHAEALARAYGCDRVEVTSGEQRVEAHAFYHRLGYEETSMRFLKSI